MNQLQQVQVLTKEQEHKGLSIQRFVQSLNYKLLVAGMALMNSNSAFADLAGGLGKAESTLTQIKDKLIVLAGIGAVLYILWQALKTWRSHGDWGDFAISAAYVAIAGAAPAIANWAWTAFQ